MAESGLAALDPGPQSASGVAVSLALQVAGFKGDAGTTPIGMGPTRFAGGASYEQKFGSDFVAKAYVERRPMTLGECQACGISSSGANCLLSRVSGATLSLFLCFSQSYFT